MFVLSKEGRRGVMVHDCVGSVSERKKEAGECVLFEGDTIAIIYPPCTYAFHNVNVDEGKSDAHIRLSSRMANRFRDVCGTYRSFVCVCVCLWERGETAGFRPGFRTNFLSGNNDVFCKSEKKILYNLFQVA